MSVKFRKNQIPYNPDKAKSLALVRQKKEGFPAKIGGSERRASGSKTTLPSPRALGDGRMTRASR